MQVYDHKFWTNENRKNHRIIDGFRAIYFDKRLMNTFHKFIQ